MQEGGNNKILSSDNENTEKKITISLLTLLPRPPHTPTPTPLFSSVQAVDDS